MKKALLALLSFTFLISASVYAEDLDTSHAPEKLAFKLVPGKTYLQTYTMDQATKLDMQGQELTQKTIMSFETSTKVSAVEGSTNKELEMVHTGMKMSTSMPPVMPEMSYDTANPDPASPMHGISGIVGKPIVMVLDENNEVVGVKGMQELIESAAQAPGSAQMLQEMLNEEQYKQMMNLWLNGTFPEEAVEPGDTWSFDYGMDMGQMGKIEMSCVATLKGYTSKNGHECAVISMTGDITLDMDFSSMAGEDPQAKQMMEQMDMKVENSSYSSTMYWDNEVGYMREMEMDMELVMGMNDPMSGKRMTIPVNQKMSSTVEIQ